MMSLVGESTGDLFLTYGVRSHPSTMVQAAHSSARLLHRLCS